MRGRTGTGSNQQPKKHTDTKDFVANPTDTPFISTPLPPPLSPPPTAGSLPDPIENGMNELEARGKVPSCSRSCLVCVL